MVTCASTQNRQRLARDTDAATTSRSTRSASPASKDSRISPQVAAIRSGVTERAWKVGAGPMKSSRSCRWTVATSPVAPRAGGGVKNRYAMRSMLGARAPESVVPPQAPDRPAARRPQYSHVLRMQDARPPRPSYSAVMRPDLPFALGGVAIGALLLADAAIAPDAGPIRPLDVVLIVVAAAAVALFRRFP